MTKILNDLLTIDLEMSFDGMLTYLQELSDEIYVNVNNLNRNITTLKIGTYYDHNPYNNSYREVILTYEKQKVAKFVTSGKYYKNYEHIQTLNMKTMEFE